ncbi:MAG TPA: NAD(P)/FAD-dependent oxidoreductase [Burkholderiales bacterium]|nr:NAD(P)/FAD-dependent oxidoreductase [Burkholderiales bacterium]
MKEAQRWLDAFAAALALRELAAIPKLFHEQCYWRDLVAFTWNIRTSEGPVEVQAMLAATLGVAEPAKFQLRNAVNLDGVIEAWFTFETALGRGIGHLRLKERRAWTLLTTLQELKGFEEKSGRTRESGLEPAAPPAPEPYVAIVGGGQCGIALAARLKRLNVPAVVLEKNARAGDSWRKRYASLVLHDPVWYDHLPYLPFPDHWPVFSPKDRIGDWLEMYVKVMGLDYRGSTECKSARYDEAEQSWEIRVEREGEPQTLRAKHLVLATGMSGFPRMPDIAGAASFGGMLVHSSAHPGGEAWRGKHCVIVGANNSAHDIAADLVAHGAAAVTLVQRSPTVVVKSEALMELAWGRLYSEAAVERGITTAIADLTVASMPFRLLASQQKPIYDAILKRDAAFYQDLAKTGFQFDMGEDGSGIHSIYLRRGGGYYIDTGASQMVIDGRIQVRSGTAVKNLNSRSVVFQDGSEIPADLVVCATGYGSMNQWAAKLISPEVAERVGKCWGLGSATRYDPGPWVGELRNLWKPTQQPGLWFHGGNLMQARHYSLYLALQLKARYESLPTPVYFIDPVHHLQ